MSIGPFSSSSSAQQTTTTVSGQGQLAKGSPIVQGGSKGSAGAKAKYLETGSVDQSGAKITQGNVSSKGPVTINETGLSPDLLTQLISGLTSPAPVSQSPVVVDAGTGGGGFDPFAEAPPAQQQADAAGQSQVPTWYYLAGGAVALILLILFLRK